MWLADGTSSLATACMLSKSSEKNAQVSNLATLEVDMISLHW
jgi:hypothetical protein